MLPECEHLFRESDLQAWCWREYIHDDAWAVAKENKIIPKAPL